MSQAGKKPTVFISYSHEDEDWKNRLVTHLRVSQAQKLFFVWEDRLIGAGEDWLKKIREAMNEASVAILLISADSLTSEFVLYEEIEHLLKRRDESGLPVFPIIVKPCDWKAVPWLARMNLRPEDLSPLSSKTEAQSEAALASIAEEVRLLLEAAEAAAKDHTHPRISISRLPVTEPELFGREHELEKLDEAWDNPATNILSLVAWAGVGKTALVNHWLGKMSQEGYRGAERVYAWSFYSQGTTDHAVSADLFIQKALTWCGDKDPTAGSPWEKGERLAHLVDANRTLLVMDGLEPLQHPPGADEGKLKDQALQSLLRQLASSNSNNGLCVISTRVPVADLSAFESTTVPLIEIEHLSPEAGAQVLRAQGVNGSQAELKQAAAEFGGHAFTLTLLGCYLSDVYNGDVSRRGEISNLEGDVRHGGHARNIMGFYEKWFGKGPELAVLRMLGLFNRPADKKAIAALRAAPPIYGLTDKLFYPPKRQKLLKALLTALLGLRKYEPLSEADWNKVLGKLRRAKLLAKSKSDEDDTLDTHPLVREHFGKQLRRRYRAAWRRGNDRLFEHLKHSVKSRPDTIEDMLVLYAAIPHGCEANRHARAFSEVYFARIQRGEEFFAPNVLGTVSADLAALSSFFEVPWERPVSSITGVWRALLLGQTGYRLWMLSRLKEAITPLEKALTADTNRKAWGYASVDAATLGAIYLTLGDLTRALTFSEQASTYSEQAVNISLGGSAEQQMKRPRKQQASGSKHQAQAERQKVRARKQRVSALNTLGDVLHHSGRLSEAEDIFQQAEGMKESEPYPSSHYPMGHRHRDLLLSQGRYGEVEYMIEQILKAPRPKDFHLIDDALNHLSLGQAHLFQAIHGDTKHFAPAGHFLNQAMLKLRGTGRQVHLPRGLLAVAKFHLMEGELRQAQTHLDEALRIAEPGDLELHKADCHLEYTRLYLVKGKNEKAAESWAKAKEIIERAGYHLRDADSLLLYARLCIAHGEKEQARESWAKAQEMVEQMGYHQRDSDVAEIERLLEEIPSG